MRVDLVVDLMRVDFESVDLERLNHTANARAQRGHTML